MIQTTPQPLFTNDLVGLIKILAIICFTVLLPVAALVVYFLKRGADGAIRELKDGDIATMRTDMNGLGQRLKQMEVEQGRTGEQIAALTRAITSERETVLSAISRASETQMRAVHDVEVQVARLEERGSIGVALEKFSGAIERLVEVVLTRSDR